MITSASHGYDNGDRILITGILGMVELNKREFEVANKTTNTFEIVDVLGNNIDSTSFSAYTSGGVCEKVYTLTSTYSEDDIFTINHTHENDIKFLFHGDYITKKLTRLTQTTFELTDFNSTPGIDEPDTFTFTGGVAEATAFYRYAITAVNEFLEESDALTVSPFTGSGPFTFYKATSSAPINLNWADVSGSEYYKIYRKTRGDETYGLIGFSTASSFSDADFTPDTSQTPPLERSIFNTAGNYPSCGAIHKQALYVAGTNNAPQNWARSRIGSFTNFNSSIPVTDADPIFAPVAGAGGAHRFKHLISLKGMVMLTTEGEYLIKGNQNGDITPVSHGGDFEDYEGTADIEPIGTKGGVLFCGPTGKDVFIFASIDGQLKSLNLSDDSNHLFKGKTIVSWSLQKRPNRVVWIVLSDGSVASFTYHPDKGVFAWCSHDFDGGLAESVSCIPNGADKYSIGFIVKRGDYKHFEVMISEDIEKNEDYKILDSYVSYDGRQSTKTLTLDEVVAGENTYTDKIEVTASSSFFNSTDVGRFIFLRYLDSSLKIEITDYVSGTVVRGLPSKNVSDDFLTETISDWGIGQNYIDGLNHLEGKELSVVGDANVLGSPYNGGGKTVSGGKITLDSHYEVIHAGLPITQDIKTLELESEQVDTGTLEKKILTVNSVILNLVEGRGLWHGHDLPINNSVSSMVELRNSDASELLTGMQECTISRRASDNGQVAIRSVDPVYSKISGIHPNIDILQ